MSLVKDFPRTHALLAGESTLHFGGQIAVRRDGHYLLNEAFGRLGPDNETSVRPDHLLCWRSAGKPCTAVAVLREQEAGRLSIDAPVARYVPEFAQPAVTLRHLLTHTSAVRFPVTGWPQASREAVLDRIKAASLREGAAPGEMAAYDPIAAWFLLGEVLQRVTGRPLGEVVREASLKGRDAFLSAPYAEVADRLAPQWSTERGVVKPLHLHEPAAVESPSPGSSCRGTAAALAEFYDDLMHGRLLSDASLKAMTARQREGMFDESFRHRVDFGLGVMVNSAAYGAQTVPYGFGLHASEVAFGHGGAQCAIGFADPANDLALAWVVNGLPGEPRHNKRNRDINTALYEDLGLAGD